MTTLLAYHNDPDKVVKKAIDVGVFIIDSQNGLIYGKRYGSARPLGCMNQEGYSVVSVCVGGRKRQVKSHRAIWISVHGIPPEGTVIDHINRRKNDNRISNLRLVDYVGNCKNRRSYKGEGNPAAKISGMKAKRIRILHNQIKSYSKVAFKCGVSRSLVAQIVRGELWN